VPTGNRLTRVIVIPRNGYVNRLQAWASSAILAHDLGAELRVMWEPEAVAPAFAQDLFAPLLIRDRFVSVETITRVVGGRHSDLPRYLTRDLDRDVVILAGHDKGEQVFMDPLLEILDGPQCPSTLLIIAGGKFALPSTAHFRGRRGEFYRDIAWHSDIDTRVHRLLQNRDAYSGLHIRGTDRSRAAPTTRQVLNALRRLRDEGGSRSLFIAADTRQARQQWSSVTQNVGFQPWTADHDVRDRRERASGLDAIVDWLLLAASITSTYSQTSTFGEEAAVAGGYIDDAVSLTATRTRRLSRTTREWTLAAIRRTRRGIHA
jgi:hypothetical protein